MKETVRVLQSEVMSITNNIQTTRAPSTCHIDVLCKTPFPDLPLLLGCPVLHTSRVGSGYSWKVKIHRRSLYDALKSTADTHLVRIWCNNWSKPSIHKKSGKVNDPTLSQLCWKSRCAFRRWKEAGRPRSGPDRDERKKCKREVKAYLNKCKARQERRQIQCRDDLFQQNHPSHFRHQHQQKAACTKLFSQGH